MSYALSYLGHGESLHGCSSKMQPLLLTLDEGYLLTASRSDLQRGIAPLGPPVPAQPRSLDVGLVLPAAAPDLGCGVTPCPGYCKQCYNEHWGTHVSFNSGFLGVYAQQWDCWVIWQFYFQLFKESPHCSL